MLCINLVFNPCYFFSGIAKVLAKSSVVRDCNISYPRTSKIPQLLNSIPALVMNSRSDSTKLSYFPKFKKWSAFIKHEGGVDLPADPKLVAAFLVQMLQDGASSATLRSTVYAISWMHEING